jgi:hypothetical protein
VIPGRIEVEDYDKGGKNVSYYDLDDVNRGGAYRNDGPDLIKARDTGYLLTNVNQGEWLKYSVSIAESGKYTMEVGVGSPYAGGKFSIKIDGKQIGSSMSLPNTGDWTRILPIKQEVELTSGDGILELYMDANNPVLNQVGLFDYINFTKVADSSQNSASVANSGTSFWMKIINFFLGR